MKFDNIIIGGGLAGLICGISLQKAGKNCAIISAGQSALHFSSGSMDLLSTLPNGEKVTNPIEAVEQLEKIAPEHPYSKIGAENFAQLTADVKSIFEELGIKVFGSAEQNHYRLTPMGILKPTWLTLDGYITADNEEKIDASRVVIFNAEGFLDFYMQFVADAVRKMGIQVITHNFNCAAFESLRNNATEMRSANLARALDRHESVDELASQIVSKSKPEDLVLLPAILGLEERSVREYLIEHTGRKIATVATLPPSVPGLRLQISLRRIFERLGGTYFLGDTALSYSSQDNHITALYSEKHSDIPFVASNYILATGSYFSRGLEASIDGVKEPLFGVDVAFDHNRNNWYNDDLLAKQPFESFGVVTDSSFRAIKDGKIIDNLYAIGAVLSGVDCLNQGCGAGVSLLTALYVARLISK